MRAAVVVPVKAFASAKGRLAEILVDTGDDEVAAFAAAHAAEVVADPGGGLSAAVGAGVAAVAAAGFDEVVVAHADLPLAAGLAALTGAKGTCTLVPDRREDGTNVIVVPTAAGFRFAYGPGSFARHVAEAERLGLVVRAVRDARLGWDVDVPEDLEVLDRCGSA